MIKSVFKIESIKALNSDTYEIWLSGDTSALTASGQFVNIEIAGCFLRRPISVSYYEPGRLLLLVKKVGEGTKILTSASIGSELDVLVGLGNGFDIGEIQTKSPLLVGGGIGIAPIYGLAVECIKKGVLPVVVLGFRSVSDMFYVDKFLDLGVKVFVSTEDGSYGLKGFVTDCIKKIKGDYYMFACGPMPMLRALNSIAESGQFSLEARMGCGFGACMGCSVDTVNGFKRVCKDGPVFRKEELKW